MYRRWKGGERDKKYRGRDFRLKARDVMDFFYLDFIRNWNETRFNARSRQEIAY